MDNTLIVLKDETVAKFEFNFEELKKFATEKVEKYQNLIITEEEVTEIKKEMAEINKYSKEIDTKRKEFEKQYKARIDPVLAQILEIKGIFDNAYSGLKTQVDKFEIAEREKKRRYIMQQIEEIVNKENLQDYYARFAIQEKWLNKTTSLKSIKIDLDDIVADIHATIEAQEQARKQKEERIEFIRQFYKMKVESYGFDINKESFFISQCDNCSANEIMSQIEKAFETEKTAKIKKDEITPEANQTKDLEPKKEPDEIIPQNEKIIAGSVKFTFKERHKEKIKFHMCQIKLLCETWENI